MNENSSTGLEIAIIGMSGAFPGSGDIDQFFNNLKNGINSISFFTDSELEASGIPPEVIKSENFVGAKGCLDKSEYFDNSFFGYTPNEALYMDPQTRLLHEFSWKALEDAGYLPGIKTDSIGMYVGGRPHFFWELLSFTEGANNGVGDFELLHLNDKDLMSTRVSYKLNLKGPSFTIYTACSTSLVAVHLACQGILSGECNIAVAGGIAVTIPEKNGYNYQEGMIMSPDGYCRPFDSKAGGTVVGNGVGLVVVKRLEAAIDDGDQIYAVIKGSAINNDGISKIGYTAPSVEGQVDVIKSAHRVARVNPNTISYVEAHGTGTALGDPIEVKALARAFNTGKRNFCGLGSVKSNIGHLDSAAGVTGLIKTILSLKYGLLFPTLHFSKPNNNIEFENSPFYIVDRLEKWERTESPLRAGVSSFGVGGTNAHLVLEEAPNARNVKQNSAPKARILLFSAKTEESLNQSLDSFVKHIQLNPKLDFSYIAYTLHKGRGHFQYRGYAVCESLKDACTALSSKTVQRSYLDSKLSAQPCYFVLSNGDIKNSILSYQYYLNNDIYREEFDMLLLKLTECTNISPSGFLNFNDQYQYGHIAAFLFNLALAKWLVKLGLKPLGIIGSGTSEYAAACLTGVFSLEDALMLVEKRNQLLEELKGQEEDFLLLETLQTDFYQTIKDVVLNVPEIPIISRYSGEDISNDVIVQDYWVNNFNINDSRSYEGIKGRDETKKNAFIMFWNKEQWEQEISLNEKKNMDFDFLFMTQSEPIEDGGKFVLEQLGQLWLKGIIINWDKLYKSKDKRKVSLPSYAFDRKRFGWDAEKIIELRNLLNDNAGTKIPKNNKDSWLYVQSWMRSEQETAVSEEKSNLYVIFAAENPLIEACIEKLRAIGHKTVVVKAYTKFTHKEADSFTINPDNVDDFDLLFKTIRDEIGEPERILHFWSLDDCTDKEMSIGESNIFGYYTLLGIARAIGNLDPAKPISIDIIANQIFEVMGNEATNPAKATLLGPLRVIPKEYPYLSCRLMDVDNLRDKGLCDMLIKEFASKGADSTESDIYAIRYQYKWEPSFRPVRSTQPAISISERFKNGGVYVITGGLGGIGLVIGRFLAQKLKAKIVFLNRSSFLPVSEWDRWYETHGENDQISRKISALRDIKAAAGEFIILKADIVEEIEVYNSFKQITDRYGVINGILHTAGTPDGSVIQHRSRKMSEAVFAAKIYGTKAIEEAMQKLNLNPDFLILFSSLSSIIAPPAQVAYCSANAFLDAFAQKSIKKGLFIQAIDWDMWRNTGMSDSQLSFRAENSLLPAVSYNRAEHPMFRYYVKHNDGRTTFISVFNTAENWFLDEHRVLDKAVLPGTCYIEMASSAYKLANQNENIILKVYDVFFTMPLVVGDDTDVTIRTTIVGNRNKFNFNIESYSGENGRGWICHAHGQIHAVEDTPKSYRLDEIRNKCDGICYNQEHYYDIRDSKFRYGPRWNNFSQGMFNNNQGLSLIEFPSRFSEDIAEYCFHPAIIDVALVYMDKSLMKSYQYAPFSYKSITMYGKVTQKVYSYIRLRAEALNNSKIIEFDITIIDEEGNGIIEIEGYKVASVTNEKINKSLLPNKNAAARVEASGENTGGISPDEGLHILNTALSTSYPRIIVSTVDLPSRVENYRREKVSVYGNSDSFSEDSKGEDAIIERLSDGDIEKILKDIWKSVLGYDKITENDDFFNLGGDSLKVLTMAEKVHQKINIKLPIAVYFNLPTIEKLVNHIKTKYDTDSEYSRIEKVGEQKYYALSSAQKRLFYQQQILIDNMAYNIPDVLFVEGDFDIDRLQYSFEQLIERYAVLRTGFDVVDGELAQIINDKVDFSIDYISMDESEVSQFVENFMQPFDLRIPPLLQVKVVKFGPRKYVWLFDIHHIIADNISVTILQNELIAIYNNGIDALEPININYIDFVYWQNDLIRKSYYEKQYQYWIRQLSGELPVLTLPTDYCRPDVLSYRGDIYTFYIEEEQAYGLKRIMKTDTITMYMNMMALFSILLYKYSGQEDILIGASLAGRNHVDLEKMVGMFASVLPFRSKVDSNLSFTEFLGKIKESILDLFENQDVQFEILVDRLGLDRNPGANPLYNVMLVMPDFKPAEMTMNNVKIYSYPFRNKSSKFDLTLWVYDFDNKIELKLEYSTDLFMRKTIETMARHFIDIVRQVTEHPEVVLKNILLESNFLKSDFEKSLFDNGDFVF